MQNKLHDTALQLAGRVSAALRGGAQEGSEVELDTGAVGVGVGVSGRGCGTCLYTVDLVSFWLNARKAARDRKDALLGGQPQLLGGRDVW